MIVARSLTETLREIAKFALGAVGGGLLIVTGGILLDVGSLRRSRARAIAPPAYNGATFSAAGWYPDPSRPGSMRWWNGFGWTDYWA